MEPQKIEDIIKEKNALKAQAENNFKAWQRLDKTLRALVALQLISEVELEQVSQIVDATDLLNLKLSFVENIKLNYTMKKHQLMNRVIDYALCYVNSNWDEWIEEDLGLSNEQFQKLIQQFQKSLDEKPTTI